MPGDHERGAEDDPGVDRLLEDEEPERDPDHRDDVGDHRGPGGAPVREQPEDQQVRQPRAEDPKPQDREDGLAVRRRGPRMLGEQGEHARDERRERDLEDRGDHRRQAADVATGVDRAACVADRRAQQRELAGEGRRPRRSGPGS